MNNERAAVGHFSLSSELMGVHFSLSLEILESINCLQESFTHTGHASSSTQ